MGHIRQPVAAGSFYATDPEILNKEITKYFISHPLGPQGKKLVAPNLLGGMVPHAGHIYSGPCAAHLYSRIEGNNNCVILLGVNHSGIGARAALSPADGWKTPLGEVQIDHVSKEILHWRLDFLKVDEKSHSQEHSLEVQLPLLQRVLKEFTIVPVSLSALSETECAQLGEAIVDLYREKKALGKGIIIIASSDLSHYLSPRETERLDNMALEPILALDPVGLLETVEREGISMCGVIPTAVLLFVAKAIGGAKASLLKHCHSGDVVPMRKVVGYASVGLELCSDSVSIL